MSDTRDLFGRAWQILQDREQWENRQRKYFIMRHFGLTRRNKPFPTAADLHLALIDDAIQKLKPFTLAQVTGSERLATFVAMRKQLKEMTESVAHFFTFELKERTNLMRVLNTVVDTMWLRGRGIIKSYVDPYDDYRIVHENVDPLFILMSDTQNDFEDADEWIHVRQISVAKFKRDRRYNNNDEAALKRIRGGSDAITRLKEQVERLRTTRDRDFEMIFGDKELREGFTHSENSDTIISWEHYIRTMGGINVYTYAPVAMDVPIREPYGVPYKVAGKVSSGFFSFVAELKDEGWYSPRGVAEKICDYEIYGSKAWNAKADSITFLSTPLLTSETPIQNPANYQIRPGEYIPGNAKFITHGNPSPALDQEIYFVRAEAEQRSQMPDFGIQRGSGQGGEKRTATENNRIASLQQVGQNHAGSIFRDDLTKLFRHDFGLMLQYKRKDMTYFVSDDIQVLPAEALHSEYLIQPCGSQDDWDKALKMQKAETLLNDLKGAPNVNQDELVTIRIEAQDPRLVRRLLIPSNIKAAKEAEDEATEIVIMQDGFPAAVQASEDHLTRIKVLLGWLQKQGMTRQPVDPLAQKRIHEHLAVHMQYLQKLNPHAFKQLMQQVKQQEQQPSMPQRPMVPRPAPRQLPPAQQPVGEPLRMI